MDLFWIPYFNLLFITSVWILSTIFNGLYTKCLPKYMLFFKRCGDILRQTVFPLLRTKPVSSRNIVDFFFWIILSPVASFMYVQITKLESRRLILKAFLMDFSTSVPKVVLSYPISSLMRLRSFWYNVWSPFHCRQSDPKNRKMFCSPVNHSPVLGNNVLVCSFVLFSRV